MAFVSYSQNFEDIMLWRALHNVSNGRYIDVGAHDPNIESVTRAFYERGWSGINIEPVDAEYQKLLLHRPRDVNLKVALGARRTIAPFFVNSSTGLSTLSRELAEAHAKMGLPFEEQLI